MTELKYKSKIKKKIKEERNENMCGPLKQLR
jgi:hypothetical protein